LITKAFFGCRLDFGALSEIGEAEEVEREKLLAVLGVAKCNGDIGENGSKGM